MKSSAISVNNSIASIDIEYNPKSNQIIDIACIKRSGSYLHSNNINDFINFIEDVDYVCGHNIFKHDLKYLEPYLPNSYLDQKKIIDTLYLSPLIFPNKPYHKLVKDDKLIDDGPSNPLNDAKKALDLLILECDIYRLFENKLQLIYLMLLKNTKEFKGFFEFLNIKTDFHIAETNELISKYFEGTICKNIELDKIILQNPIELAYTLALINASNKTSLTPFWVLKNHSEVERIHYLLKNKPCVTGCSYCNEKLDVHKALNNYFGFKDFRKYDGENLQEEAARSAVENESLLAIFPTGGGKSLTYQLPALMSADNYRGLTVIISPLQSLMKDQVDNLEKKGITEAVTINGLLDPIERANAFERIEEGIASILYISPESLRSKSIERLLLRRKISRFVIDEAHCFSAWGQDFRVDYLYIGDFIKGLQEKKNLGEPIPVSCFTATAKQKVIDDILIYFKDKLNLKLRLFKSLSTRTNLKYKVLMCEDENTKNQQLRRLLEERNCPTIVYVSRTKKAVELARKLSEYGFNAKPFHGKMDSKEKTENQNSFINGEVNIIVATSAFGMGVDKKDVKLVVHYEISNSLENYVQEAGRAGRDENITAECFILFNEDDLDKHFILLNQTKLSIKEVQQIWKAIKELTKIKSEVSNSALEIARKAGWDENVSEMETRVKTAIAALDNAGYLSRGQNSPRIYANSILAKSSIEAIAIIEKSSKFDEKQKELAKRIITKLFSSKSRKSLDNDTAESRIDYISDHLGIVTGKVIEIINLLREERIIADTKDLTAYIKKNENKTKLIGLISSFQNIEEIILSKFSENEIDLNIKEVNKIAEELGIRETSVNNIKLLLNFLGVINLIKKRYNNNTNYYVRIKFNNDQNSLLANSNRRYNLAKFVLSYLVDKIDQISKITQNELGLLEFSVYELLEEFRSQNQIFKEEVNAKDIEESLFFLSRMDIIKIEGGFLVVYNKLNIKRNELNNKIQYKIEDYDNLAQFYSNKIQQVHIVGEYAKKMVEDYSEALKFVDDYFQLNYRSFLTKYFKGTRHDEINQNLTPTKFKKLFGILSPRQLNIIKDSESYRLIVAAGPGSGKTKVLVHKLASVLLLEDIKSEQLLMLTFSRAAASEFKIRLMELVGNAANFVEIKTFHSFCFDLLGKIGDLESSQDIIRKAVEKIKNNEIEISRITKLVLVIDEAQDITRDEFELIQSIINFNEEIRVIAVGDDDQNIYEFRGSDSKYFSDLAKDGAKVINLVENFRSTKNIVDLSNRYISKLSGRIKVEEIFANNKFNGNVELIKHSSNELVSAVVECLENTFIKGSTAILTIKNEESLQIAGILKNKGYNAVLIQSHDEVRIKNLYEVRYLIELVNSSGSHIISETDWESIISKFKTKFKSSSLFKNIIKLLTEFHLVNNKVKYKSDFMMFLEESKFEDYLHIDSDKIIISTIHKAKGREFDNVILLLNINNDYSDSTKRLIYVGITRAKQNLRIHYNSNLFQEIDIANVVRRNDKTKYKFPKYLTVQLKYDQVWLDFFISCQRKIDNLVSGDELMIDEKGLKDNKGQYVVIFSKQFIDEINSRKNNGFSLYSATVSFIVYWKKKETEKEYKVILPQITFINNKSIN